MRLRRGVARQENSLDEKQMKKNSVHLKSERGTRGPHRKLLLRYKTVVRQEKKRMGQKQTKKNRHGLKNCASWISICTFGLGLRFVVRKSHLRHRAVAIEEMNTNQKQTEKKRHTREHYDLNTHD